METNVKTKTQGRFWRNVSIILIIVCVVLVIVVIALLTSKHGYFPTCGDSNVGVIDLAEPDRPGPFHDLTKHEINQLREFLEREPNIKAVKAEGATVSQSVIYLMDLFPAKKSDVLKYLEGEREQPDRQARVLMFRGDLNPPMVEEYICGPLPIVSNCSILKSKRRRNPVEFSLRPHSLTESNAITNSVITKIDEKIGYILEESYGCKLRECLVPFGAPVGTNLVGNINERQLWLSADYKLEYYILHPTGLGFLLNLAGSDPNNFTVSNVWYNGQLFRSMDHLIKAYNSSSIKKSKMTPPKYNETLFSTLYRRGDPLPRKPQRPPMLTEPDGRRYSLKNRKVEYLGWTFYFRMSALTGPSLFDVRYKGERIAYELGLAEIAVFYSAKNPMRSTTNYVDSSSQIGPHSKSLVPGGDCPETATFVNATFAGEVVSEAVEFQRAFCLFENNNGYPLRRHLSFAKDEGAFYGGMLDSALTLRSVLTIINYDYILDFIFHQNGVIETRIMSTGYILPSFYKRNEKQYGFQIHDNIIGNVHHHLFHFKVDIDIHGTSNRYETLEIKPEQVKMKIKPGSKYYQTKIEQSLKRTEKEALFEYDFNHPKYHVVYNSAKRTKFDTIKAYRIGLHGMSKQLIRKDWGNEGTIPWARHQMVVTKHKDDELVSSSPYASWDSLHPVTNFSDFYEDDENIIDEDLVFWITQGMHHIPHTEDLPITPTVGNHLTFFLLPYNYFDECPSVASRDHIRIQYKDPTNSSKGLTVDRSGNSHRQCALPDVANAYDQLLEKDPDIVIQTNKSRALF